MWTQAKRHVYFSEIPKQQLFLVEKGCLENSHTAFICFFLDCAIYFFFFFYSKWRKFNLSCSVDSRLGGSRPLFNAGLASCQRKMHIHTCTRWQLTFPESSIKSALHQVGSCPEKAGIWHTSRFPMSCMFNKSLTSSVAASFLPLLLPPPMPGGRPTQRSFNEGNCVCVCVHAGACVCVFCALFWT